VQVALDAATLPLGGLHGQAPPCPLFVELCLQPGVAARSEERLTPGWRGRLPLRVSGMAP
jgi:hypothetical protein